MTHLRLAVAFLTRIPMGGLAPDDGDLGRAAVWFPLVGALIGGAIGAIYLIAAEVLPGTVAVVLALTFGLVLTGALHEDGLADTVDAFAGGWTRSERLRILQDPTHGTFGVLALICSFSLRLLAIATLSPSSALRVLPAAHALSRATAVGLMGWGAPAREGLGADYARRVTRRDVSVAVVVGIAIAAVLLPWEAIGMVAACAVVGVFMRGLAEKKIGGITGDVLGATQQLSEIAVLLLAIAG